MIIDMTINLENIEKSRQAILDLMASPYCDQFMFLSLSEKLDRANAKIEELKQKEK
jgi:hypothetical protein